VPNNILKEHAGKPKLYKIHFGNLFQGDESRKYIPDPLPLLMKAAVNLSAVFYSRTRKLLPVCGSEESDTLTTDESWEIPKAAKSLQGSQTPVCEIRFASDDENYVSPSVCSDITCDD
jgi:hypothetical protein